MEHTQPNSPLLYNSRIIHTYLNLLKVRYPHINIGQLLGHANMKPYEVTDQWHWFSQEQINLFYERLVELTGNRNIAREAGRYAASPDTIGVMRHYVLGLFDPARLYEIIGKTTPKFTRSSCYQSRKLGKNRVEVSVTPYEGIQEQEFQCLNRIGFLEAIVTIFYDDLPKIEHPECIFRGDSCCRYVISWRQPPFSLLKKIRNICATISLGALPFLYILDLEFFLHSILAICLPAFLVSWIFLGNHEKNEIKRSMENLRLSSDALIEQIEHNFNNALLTNTIAQSISKETTIRDILKSLISNFQHHLDFDRGLVLLANNDKTILSFEAGYGYSDKLENLLKKTTFHLDRQDAKGAFVVSFKEKRSILINDINDIENDLSPRSREYAKRMGVQSFICCPIVYDNEAIGILAVDNIASKRPLLNSDLNLLGGIAPIIGISIRNAQLLQNRKQQFSSTLRALAATIDARDPLTAGHSERVTYFTLGICRELALCEEDCEKIRVAALLHDYGKIAVPDAILKKTGRLSAREYDMVKTHADQTRLILEGIQFEGIYKDVPTIAGAHHEKLDGSGYPQGLTDTEIPLGAKIIAVADFFEAITSKRHYREPMPINVAIDELKKERGTHFDKAIVDAFLSYFEREQAIAPEVLKTAPRYSSRESIRVHCQTPLTIHCEGIRTEATIKDISTRGLFAATALPALEGSKLKLSFVLPDACASPMEVDGRVVWTNHPCLPRKASFPAGIGIAFTELEKTHLDTLMQFVHSQFAPIPQETTTF